MHRRSFLGLCAASVAAVGLGKFIFSEEKFDDEELAALLREGRPVTGKTFRVSKTIMLPAGAVVQGCMFISSVRGGEPVIGSAGFGDAYISDCFFEFA